MFLVKTLFLRRKKKGKKDKINFLMVHFFFFQKNEQKQPRLGLWLFSKSRYVKFETQFFKVKMTRKVNVDKPICVSQAKNYLKKKEK